MKGIFKHLSLVVMLLTSAICYATEAQQNIEQVSGIVEGTAYDVGWSDAALEVIYFEMPMDIRQVSGIVEGVTYDVGLSNATLEAIYFEIPPGIGFYNINIINSNFQNYGANKIFSNPLYGNAGGKRSNECGYTKMAFITSTDRSWMETSGIHRLNTFKWQSRTACTEQRRC